MGTAVVGALRVTLGLDSAEFVQGMQSAQARMAGMSKSFTADSKTVRESAKSLGISVGAMAREFGTIKALVDPATVALQGYQQQAKLLREAMRLGVITQEQYKASVQAAHSAYVSAGKGIVASSGAQRAGMQQLGFQVSDLAVQMASGTDAMRAFALQGPQMVQAVALMAGSTGRFAAFMAGPWGAALTAGTAILGALGVAYLNAGEDADKSAKSQRSFADVLRDSAASWKEVTEAARDYADQLKKNRQVTLLTIQDEAALIQEKIKSAMADRQKLLAAQEAANAQAGRRYNPETGQYETVGKSFRGMQIQKEIDENRKAIQALHALASELRIKTADVVAELNSDPQAKVKAGFDILRDSARNTIGDIETLTKRLSELNKQEKAALDALNDSRRSTASNAASASFASPLPGARLTGRFGEQRPGHRHGGIDLAAPTGTAVQAPQVGVVEAVGFSATLGKFVVIDHGGGTRTRYGHLSDNSLVAKGDAVAQGQTIGKVGSTGRSTGPHLHYEVRVNGKPVDPGKGAFPIDELKSAGSTNDAQRAAEDRARAETELGRLKVEQLALEADYTGNLAQMRDAELARIDEDLAAAERDLKLRDGISETMRQSLLAAEQANAEKRRELVQQEHGRRLAEQQFALDQADLRAQIDAAGLRADLADTAEQRLKAELELFDLQEREREAQLRKVLATEKQASAAYQSAQAELAALEATRGTRRDILARRNETPAQRYLRDVDLTADEINEAIDGIRIDALDRLNDGLVDAITGVKSLGAVFRDISTQIIADLLRIAIRKAIIGPLAETLFGSGASKLLGGVLSPGGGIGGGILAGRGDALGINTIAKARLPGFAIGGSLLLGGDPGHDRNLLSLNDTPIARVSRGETMEIVPQGRGGTSQVVNHNYYTLPSDEFWSRVDGRAGAAVAEAGPVIAQASSAMAAGRAARMQGRSLVR